MTKKDQFTDWVKDDGAWEYKGKPILTWEDANLNNLIANSKKIDNCRIYHNKEWWTLDGAKITRIEEDGTEVELHNEDIEDFLRGK